MLIKADVGRQLATHCEPWLLGLLLLGLSQGREMARHRFANAEAIDASRKDAAGKARAFTSREQPWGVGAL